MNLPSQTKNAIACGWHTNHEPEQVDVILKNGIILRLKSISSLPHPDSELSLPYINQGCSSGKKWPA